MLKQYRPLKPYEFLVCGVDTAAGGNDYCAAQFISKTYLDVPMVIHSNLPITAVTPTIHNELERVYNETQLQPVVAYERQNGGVFELERLATLNREGKYKIYTMPTYGSINNAEVSKIGWDTNTATRPKMLQDLKQVIDTKAIRLYDKQTVKELFTFIINKQGKPEAEDNSHDDLVMALAIAWQLYQTENQPLPEHRIAVPQYKPSDEVIGIWNSQTLRLY